MQLSRRELLGGGFLGATALASGLVSRPAGAEVIRSRVPDRKLRRAGSRPRPEHPVGTDQVPQIKHIVVVMMENHSFDNVLGMSGRGDGFTLGSDGLPTASNPDGHGNLIHSFHMPTECQNNGIGNDWRVAHEAYDGGTNQGFVTSTSAEAMGYFTYRDLPFTCGMAKTFPIADRYFSSALAQTDPNRRYLIAGTSLGLINDTFPSALPPNGVIFNQLNDYGISWKDYYSSLPTLGVFLPLLQDPAIANGLASINQFHLDAAAGNLPVFLPSGTELHHPVRGESPRRPVRRPVHG